MSYQHYSLYEPFILSPSFDGTKGILQVRAEVARGLVPRGHVLRERLGNDGVEER